MSYKLLSKLFFLLSIFCIVGISFVNLRTSFFKESADTAVSGVITYGRNNYAQLGFSSEGIALEMHTANVPQNSVDVAAGRLHSLVRTHEGDIYIWGGNDWKQLGFKSDALFVAEPTKIQSVTNVSSASASNNHSLLLKDDGTVWAFGSNFSGQLGTGDNEIRHLPTKVSIDSVKEIAAGYKFSTALKNDGTVWAWGASCDTSTKRDAELWWKNMTANLTSIDGGYYDPNGDAMVTYDKNEYCINEDVVGIESKTPVQIEGLSSIQSISAGYGHVLALKEDGTVSSFGCNTYKQLGWVPRDRAENPYPHTVSDLSNIIAVSAGYRHSLALSKDGTLWGWGQNSHGQLGTGTLNDAVFPIKISIDNVEQIVAGYDFSFVVKKDGSVWGWGRNAGGWFGEADVEFINTPKQVPYLQNVTRLAAGGAHILAIQELQTNEQ